MEGRLAVSFALVVALATGCGEDIAAERAPCSLSCSIAADGRPKASVSCGDDNDSIDLFNDCPSYFNDYGCRVMDGACKANGVSFLCDVKYLQCGLDPTGVSCDGLGDASDWEDGSCQGN